jgi:peptide/nickel transport system permease protein
MYAGFVVEEASTAQLLAAPAHPYTQLLLAASPSMTTAKDVPLTSLEGRMPGPGVDLPGCYFADRCPRADATCVSSRPPLVEVDKGQKAACWHPLTGRAPVPHPIALSKKVGAA